VKGEYVTDALVAVNSRVPGVRLRIKRTSLGLEIVVSKADSGDSHPTTSEHFFTDDVFDCSQEKCQKFYEDLQRLRPQIEARIIDGSEIDVFVPETDPPIIRKAEKGAKVAYFSLGEMLRWRLLSQTPDYPFKDHQRAGVDWLRENRAAILADDMGLGKTLQAIAALELSHRAGKLRNALILCPKSLIGNWEAEIALWSPHLCTVALHSTASAREWKAIASQCHVAITNYEALRSSSPNSDAFDLIIYDEIHKLKNYKSKNHIAASGLKPLFGWGLSGTPIENSADDLVSILHLLDPKRVALSDRDLGSASLRSLGSKYILRRERDVISTELTEITEKTEPIPLTAEQKTSYNAVVQQSRASTQGDWIQTFNKLRDICDFDPKTKRSAKLDRAVTIIEAVSKLSEKVVVFSYRIEPLEILRTRLIEKFGAESISMITGQTSSIARSRIVESFQKKDTPFVLLCSMRATAEGLTLTAANHVVFVNEWWNPSLNRQARDRVNRIGQTKDVFVYRLRAMGTVENRLDQILKEKTTLFDEIVTRLTKSPTSDPNAIPKEIEELINKVGE